jgi:hypothetical protein
MLSRVGATPATAAVGVKLVTSPVGLVGTLVSLSGMNGALPMTGCPVGTMVGGASTAGAALLASGALVEDAMDEKTDAMSKASSSFRL